MSLVSLSVQASSVESPKCEYVNPSVNAGLPDIQSITLETAPADCVVLTMPQTIFLVANNPAMMCSIKRKRLFKGYELMFPNARSDTSINQSIARIIAYTAYCKLITPY